MQRGGYFIFLQEKRYRKNKNPPPKKSGIRFYINHCRDKEINLKKVGKRFDI
jgi:hypothetical protein